MNDSMLKDLLAYQKPIADSQFVEQIIKQIEKRNKQRSLIMWCCGLLGLLFSVAYLVTTIPANWLQLLTPINAIMLPGLALFITWLWTIEVNNS